MRLALALTCVLGLAAGGAGAAEPWRIGLDAAFTGGSAAGAAAIRVGVEAAIDEINAAGGVAGRPLALEVTDHQGNPRRAVDNFAALIDDHGIVALLIGVQSPAAIAQLELAQARNVPLVSAWAAATGLVDNGLTPNPAFRVSVRDADAAAFLVGSALKAGRMRLGLLVENTPWGKSNEAGVRAALDSVGSADLVHVGWSGYGGEDFAPALADTLAQKPDALIFVGQPPVGVELMQALAALPADARPALLMHWGVAAGDVFLDSAPLMAGLDAEVLQTFSFHAPHDPAAAAHVLAITCRLHAICSAEQVRAPVGLAHGYDATHLIALGLKAVASGAQPDLRTALEHLPPHDGLVRRYAPAFTPDRHEALGRRDYILAHFDAEGRLMPLASGLAP